MVGHVPCIFDQYTDENQPVFLIGLPGSVYLLNSFPLIEFGLAKLPHGFNRFLLTGI